MIDVSPITDEAKPIATQVVEVFLKHTEDWLVGLLIHGSAYKGGIIPGCSDIDFQVYLNSAAFSENGRFPLRLSMAIHRDLAKIEPSPFGYIQSAAYLAPLDLENCTQTIMPGAYHVLWGKLPVREASVGEIWKQARDTMEALEIYPFDIAQHLLEHGDKKLERCVRLLCTKVWPVLYSFVVCYSKEPETIWQLPKPNAIELLPADEPSGAAIRSFYKAVLVYYCQEQSVGNALNVIGTGADFLKLAKSEYELMKHS